MPEINSISIIIPTFNEEKHIRNCLEGIVNNNYPLELIQTIVIDGGSKDKTCSIASEYQSALNLQIINAPGTSVYSALNIGLGAATGDYIVRVDARSIIPKGYISQCINNLKQFSANVAGGVQKQFGENVLQKTIAEVLQSGFGTGNAKFRTGNFSGFVDTVYLGVFKREIFDKVGTYDDDGIVVSEDSMMNARIREIGGKIYLDGNLIVLYPAKSSIKELGRQYFIYGGAKAHTFQKYKKLTASRQYIVLGSFLISAIIAILSLLGLISLLFIVIPVVLYLSIILYSAIKLKMNHKKNVSLFYAFFAYPAIHFPWVTGFFCRIIFGNKGAAYFFRTKRKPY